MEKAIFKQALSFNNDVKIAFVLNNIVQHLSAMKIPDHNILDIELCIEEVVTNIISYGLKNSGTSCKTEILLELQCYSSYIQVTIKDMGNYFDFTKTPGPDMQKYLQQTKKGGLGIHLVKSLMNQVEYYTNNGFNVTVLKKCIV
jgi:anti-sigma regulatory factor (Ser/Thr protein kinase)